MLLFRSPARRSAIMASGSISTARSSVFRIRFPRSPRAGASRDAGAIGERRRRRRAGPRDRPHDPCRRSRHRGHAGLRLSLHDHVLRRAAPMVARGWQARLPQLQLGRDDAPGHRPRRGVRAPGLYRGRHLARLHRAHFRGASGKGLVSDARRSRGRRLRDERLRHEWGSSAYVSALNAGNPCSGRPAVSQPEYFLLRLARPRKPARASRRRTLS